MTSATIGMIMGLKALVVFSAFASTLYFAALLWRAKVSGARFILSGGTAIVAGILLGGASYSLGGLAYWPSLVLEAVGAVVAAYGFALVTRATIRNAPRQ
jgi:hypothetical protein